MAQQPSTKPSTPADASADASSEVPADTRPTRAAEDADARGLAVEFLTREGTGRPTAIDFGGDPIVKTIVVQRGDSFVFVLTPLDAQFSWPPLRAHLGVNRLSLPDADAAFAATGIGAARSLPWGHRPRGRWCSTRASRGSRSCSDRESRASAPRCSPTSSHGRMVQLSSICRPRTVTSNMTWSTCSAMRVAGVPKHRQQPLS